MIYKGHIVNNPNELKSAIIINQKKIHGKIKTMKLIFLSLLELIGILSLFFAVTTFKGYTDSFPIYERSSYEYYGGDAYTGIQHATVDVSKNIAESGDILKNYVYDFSYTMGGLLLIIGLLIIIVSTFHMIKTIYSPIIINQTEIDSIMNTEMAIFDLSQMTETKKDL